MNKLIITFEPIEMEYEGEITEERISTIIEDRAKELENFTSWSITEEY